jgi:rhodanese-related sulfurtransferase
MVLTVVCFAVALLSLPLVLRIKGIRDQREMEQHSITAEELHSLLTSNLDVLLLDVRQPLDLLAYPEIIPGAHWIPPKEVLEKPTLIPKEKEGILYCTCPGEKTSRAVLHRALTMHFPRIKFLKGGLAAWKAKDYPVEPYREGFALHSRTELHRAKGLTFLVRYE